MSFLVICDGLPVPDGDVPLLDHQRASLVWSTLGPACAPALPMRYQGRKKNCVRSMGEAVNHHELDVFLRRAPKFAITKRTPAMPAAQRSASWMADGGDSPRVRS